MAKRLTFSWLQRLAFGVVGLILAGALFQAVAEAIDQRRYPPTGKLIRVNDHRLHLNVSGEGSPTVVLDAGLSRTSLDWIFVQPEVSKLTRVCSYDLAGYGWSDFGPNPRTSRQLAMELRTLLHNARIDGPYVLVGHSFGGLNIRMFASLFPNEVAGLVLVDSTHEDQRARFEAMQSWNDRLNGALQWQRYRLSRPIMARLGITRLRGEPNAGTYGLPPTLHPVARALGLRSRAYDWIFTESASIPASEAEVRAADPLHDVPLVVVSAHPKSAPPGVSVEEADRIWLELQGQLARLTARGRQVVAENSGHMIPLDRPDAVIEAVRQIVESVRGET